jgi:hypothetical protein
LVDARRITTYGRHVEECGTNGVTVNTHSCLPPYFVIPLGLTMQPEFHICIEVISTRTDKLNLISGPADGTQHHKVVKATYRHSEYNDIFFKLQSLMDNKSN